MEISEYKNIYENENNHFFYKANHKIILSLVSKYLMANSQKLKAILDVGCGTGLLTKKLERFGWVTGIDASRQAIKYSRKRDLKVKLATITKIPFPDKSFDLVTCVDVLTHKSIKSDLKALKEIYRVLKPGGILILRVSANSWLKLAHDRHVWIRQRYDKYELYKKLTEAGFKIEKLSFVNAILLPLAFAKSFFEKNKAYKPRSAVTKLPGLINNLMYLLILPEVYLIKYIDISFGIGLIAVAQKPILRTFR